MNFQHYFNLILSSLRNLSKQFNKKKFAPFFLERKLAGFRIKSAKNHPGSTTLVTIR
jgi:hypothetical protein